MGPNARTRQIRDRFIAGHPSCDLRRHLDGVPHDTPIRDIVDRCRVWQSHADTNHWRVVKPMSEKAQPVYAVSLSVGLADLEAMLKRLLPDMPAQAPPPLSAATDIEAMLKCLLTGTLTQAPQPHQGLVYDIVLLLGQIWPRGR